MKRCLSCFHCYTGSCSGDNWQCPACSISPKRLGEFYTFAPALMEEGGGFESSAFERLFQVEESHFWFRSRNKVITWALAKFFPAAGSLLEVGCGTGYVLKGIQEAFPTLRVSGSEIFMKGLELAASRVSGASLFQMDARIIPFQDEFDVIGMFDVLEHIPEDEEVLRQLYQAVRPHGGGIILTIPQHPFLWGPDDEFAHHVRRYTKQELLDKVKGAGFQIQLVTSFNFLPLPLMVVSRLCRRVRVQQNAQNYDPQAEFNIPAWINATLEKVLDVERFLIRRGLAPTWGASLVLIATRA